MLRAARSTLTISWLSFVLLHASAQTTLQEPGSSEQLSRSKMLADLSNLADEAHKKADIRQEILYRQRFSAEAWDNYSHNPKSPGRFNRWSIVFFNDLPLGLLLEGTHEWLEAEAVFRHNQAELEHERLAGNDIKSENQLHLAHLLALEGKQSEAKSICSHWEKRVRHNADFAIYAVKHDVPVPPLYDTPEVEVAQWDLACGRQEEGLKILNEQMAAHPEMLVSYTVLGNYYFAEGDFQNAVKTERAWTSARAVR